MPSFKRAFVPGGIFFFTVVTYQRQPIFQSAGARRLLRDALIEVRAIRPFRLEAMVLLPDHLHCIWTLPPGDADFSTRWRKIKERFTRQYASGRHGEPGASVGQDRKGMRGIWQPRFWEHVIRNETDLSRYVD